METLLFVTRLRFHLQAKNIRVKSILGAELVLVLKPWPAGSTARPTSDTPGLGLWSCLICLHVSMIGFISEACGSLPCGLLFFLYLIHGTTCTDNVKVRSEPTVHNLMSICLQVETPDERSNLQDIYMGWVK